VFDLDMHFWVSLIGTHAERGASTKLEIAEDLAKHSSLSRRQAIRLLDALIGAGKIRTQSGRITLA
jgi:hypothetical protein